MLRRFTFFLAGLLFAGVAARAETPAPLQTALGKLLADTDRWSYTQTTQVYDKAGKPDGGPTVERFDPSRPDGQQWTLMLWEGKVPDDGDRASWERRKKREKRRRERPLGEIMELTQARLAEETATTWVYEVPIKPGASRRLPSEKFFVLVRVGKERTEIEHVDVRIREAFRMRGIAGVAKVDQFELGARFAVVDPQFAAQPAEIRTAGSAKIAWVYRMSASADVLWTDFKRVKPFRERGEVTIGELKALDF